MKYAIGAKQDLLLSRIGSNASAQFVMTVLSTARHIDAACAELLAKHHLSEGRLAALLAVSAEPGITPRLLSSRIEVTSATVTGLLDRLERDGLIARQPHAHDRRTHTLVTTPDGEQLIAALVPSYARWLSRLAAGISTAEREGAATALATVQHNLSTEELA